MLKENFVVKKFISAALLVLLMFSLIGCSKDNNINFQSNSSHIDEVDESKYNQQLWDIAEQNNNVRYKENEIMDKIEKIYYSNVDLMVISRTIMANEIYEECPYENVRITDSGFIIDFPMENKTFSIVTDYDGRITNMFIYGDSLHDPTKFFKVKSNMTLEDFKKIFPETISVEFEDENGYEYIINEVVFKNGEVGTFNFKKENNKFILSDKRSSIVFDKNILNYLK